MGSPTTHSSPSKLTALSAKQRWHPPHVVLQWALIIIFITDKTDLFHYRLWFRQATYWLKFRGFPLDSVNESPYWNSSTCGYNFRGKSLWCQLLLWCVSACAAPYCRFHLVTHTERCSQAAARSHSYVWLHCTCHKGSSVCFVKVL